MLRINLQALVCVVAVPVLAESAGLWVLLRGTQSGATAGAVSRDPSSALVALLVLIYTLEGLGRGVFEGPNRAVYADWFENQREMAFACWIVQSGGSASVAFFMLALDVNPTIVS